MGLFDWVIAGLIVGAIARWLLPGRHPIGCLGTILLGAIGVWLGGRLWREIFGPEPGIAWIGSVVVAMVILGVFRRLTYRRYPWR